VELLGGTISFRSSQGNGTEFTVRLSYALASEEQIRVGVRRTTTYLDQVLYGKNVLLAEDNHVNAEVIVKILGMKGIHAHLAADGQEAVELFRSHGPYYFQAVLMDLMMPVISGVEAAKKIRQLPQVDAGTVPVIALTADVTEEVKERCRQAGMNAFIEKPIDPDRLFGVLAAQFDRSEADPEETAVKDPGREDRI